MYKVFFKDRTLFLTDNIDQDISIDFNAVHKYTSPNELQQFINHFNENEELEIGYIYAGKIDFLYKKFCDCFKVLIAAGGYVLNSKNEFLGMQRLGVYDLPKGKAEKGESIEQTALREVEEECGISDLSITSKLTDTYHTYELKGKLILKKTEWFQMYYGGTSKPIPQTEENITEVKWYNQSFKEEFSRHTYASIRELLQQT